MLRSQVAPQLVLRRAATAAEWDTHWRGCEYATYFHSRAWAEAWQRYSSGRRVPAPLLLRFSDDVEAVLPLTEELTHRGFGRLTWSSPAGTFGGWISRNRLELGHAHQLAEVLLKAAADVWRP